MGIVDVWFDERKVGTYNIPQFRCDDLPGEIAIRDDFTIEELSSVHWVRVQARACTITSEEMMSGATMAGCNPGDPRVLRLVTAHHDIPDYARKYRDEMNNTTRFRWNCATPTPDQYELMFDHNAFTPV